MASVDHRSAADIQREIEEERNALTRTLDEIHDRLTFDSLSNDLMDRVKDGGGELGRSALRGVKDNPVPLALTAAGLAWLLISRRGTPDEASHGRTAVTPAAAHRGATFSTSSTLDRDTSPPAPLYNASGHPLSHDGSRWDTDDREDSGNEASRLSRASDAFRSGARHARASAADLRRRITEGTEDLSSTARKRVIAARTQAYEAQLKAEHYTARGREKATDLFEDHPLVVGALAIAVGAALGGLIPRTRREDGALGAYSDQVFGEAERIYREERARLESIARDAASEAGDVAADVVSQVRDNVEQGAERAQDIARAKLSEAGSEALKATDDAIDTDGPGDGKPRLRKV